MSLVGTAAANEDDLGGVGNDARATVALDQRRDLLRAALHSLFVVIVGGSGRRCFSRRHTFIYVVGNSAIVGDNGRCAQNVPRIASHRRRISTIGAG